MPKFRPETYTVYGDYGYTDETELFTSTSEQEAIDWAKNYVRDGDTGGYMVIEVAYHATTGEYQTVYTYQKSDSDEFVIDEW